MGNEARQWIEAFLTSLNELRPPTPGHHHVILMNSRPDGENMIMVVVSQEPRPFTIGLESEDWDKSPEQLAQTLDNMIAQEAQLAPVEASEDVIREALAKSAELDSGSV